jgi:hypothetical protein
MTRTVVGPERIFWNAQRPALYINRSACGLHTHLSSPSPLIFAITGACRSKRKNPKPWYRPSPRGPRSRAWKRSRNDAPAVVQRPASAPGDEFRLSILPPNPKRRRIPRSLQFLVLPRPAFLKQTHLRARFRANRSSLPPSTPYPRLDHLLSSTSHMDPTSLPKSFLAGEASAR